jgi:metal-dependent hydrolase (beta-lactamase superfamily II)
MRAEIKRLTVCNRFTNAKISRVGKGKGHRVIQRDAYVLGTIQKVSRAHEVSFNDVECTTAVASQAVALDYGNRDGVILIGGCTHHDSRSQHNEECQWGE